MLHGILAISGQRGLYKVISQAKNSIIVESLIDGKRMPAYASSRISALEDISIYTEDDDVKLFDVFKTIFEKESGGQVTVVKGSNNELKAYFEEILPEFDKDRVYVSDIKKVYTWYNLLVEKEIINADAIEKALKEEVKEQE